MGRLNYKHSILPKTEVAGERAVRETWVALQRLPEKKMSFLAMITAYKVICIKVTLSNNSRYVHFRLW